MIKRKRHIEKLILSLLLVMVSFSMPLSQSSFAEEKKADTVQEAGGESRKPVKPATVFLKEQSKEKAKASPQSLKTKNFNLVDAKPQKYIETFDEYTLGAEDRIKITVFGEKELSDEYRVGSDGTIAFPLIGDLSVEGLTLRQAEEIIETKLKEGYLKKPSVSIEVSESRPFYILGEVRRPGSYNYVAGMSVLQAVAISGGFTYRANRKSVEILRGNKAPSQPINVAPNEKVKPGDIIFIQERFF